MVDECNNCGWVPGDHEEGLDCMQIFVDAGFTGLVEIKDYDLVSTEFGDDHKQLLFDFETQIAKEGRVYVEIHRDSEQLELLHTSEIVRFLFRYRNHQFNKTLDVHADFSLHEETEFSDGTLGLEFKP